MNQQTGKMILIIGIVIIGIGIIIYFFHDRLKWLGKLPGDVSVEREGFSFYFPWVTMLVLSLIITLLFNLFKKFF